MPRRIAYLYSRYPVISQTFCDSEMLELESLGLELTIGSLNPPGDAFRHERHRELRADVLYPPPPGALRAMEREAEGTVRWGETIRPLIERHRKSYGASFKPEVRARNALYFARVFRERGIDHVHVHFANRATHTALFLKALTGIPFSFTAHAQDFMVDLGSDDLLRELCREAVFIVAVSDWSRKLLAETCPDSEAKIHRIYNGIRLADFPEADAGGGGPLRLISVGRLIEFKGLHHLIGACGRLKERGIEFECTLIGEGPWRERLLQRRDEAGLTDEDVRFLGARTQEQVKAELASSHVFVLPSIIDAQGASDILPTVIMEAMAARLPVVSTRLVGIPEMVRDGQTGFLVPPADEEALADALARLAGDGELRRRMGDAGHELAGERFQRSDSAEALARRFRDAVSQHPTPHAEGGDRVPRLVYLVETWPCAKDGPLAGELRFVDGNYRDDILIMACGLPEGFKPDTLSEGDARLLQAVEWLPDGMVLEGDWLQLEEERWELIRLRGEVSGSYPTERYLVDARRALGLSTLLRKRGIEHVHAARSSTALTAWMTWKLGAAKRFSFAAEEKPVLDLKTLKGLANDAEVWSLAGEEESDRLGLSKPAMRRLEVGPMKIRLGQVSSGDRGVVYQAWVKALLKGGSES